MDLKIKDINYKSDGFDARTSKEISSQITPNKFWIIDWGYWWTEITKSEYDEVIKKWKEVDSGEF